VSISLELFIDIFPRFTFYAEQPKPLWLNRESSNWSTYSIDTNIAGAPYNVS